MHDANPQIDRPVADGRDYALPSVRETAVTGGGDRAGQTADSLARRTMLADGVTAVASAIEEDRWLEALALVECLLSPATAEALQRGTDDEWAAVIHTAVYNWRLGRNAGVDWHFRRATADSALRVRPDDPLWLAAHDGLTLLTALAAIDTP